jgi:hypothetical protein
MKKNNKMFRNFNTRVKEYLPVVVQLELWIVGWILRSRGVGLMLEIFVSTNAATFITTI